MKIYLFIIFVGVLVLQVNAQKINEDFRLKIRKSTLPIKIDGVADDEAWQDTDVARDFFMVLPMDTAQANERSEIRMTYDDENIYLVGTFYKTTAGHYFVESMRRDFSFSKNDNFLVFIDPLLGAVILAVGLLACGIPVVATRCGGHASLSSGAAGIKKSRFLQLKLTEFFRHTS